MSEQYWEGKRAVVTGGSQGLGLVIATVLAERGASVVIAARDADRLTHAAEQLRNRTGAVVEPLACDVTVDRDVERLVSESVERLGGIDFWGNSVGKSSRRAVADVSMDEFQELWELNFLTTARCSLAALPHLTESRGHLVNIGSLASKFAPRWLGAYPASKFPLAALCQQLRLEQAEHGLHCLLVCPGPLTRDDTGSRYQEQAAGVPQAAQGPGGGAQIKTIDPRHVALKILQACERRKPELILPGKARWLAIISQLSPTWGDWLLRRNSS